MKPSSGRIVHYTLNAGDVDQIDQQYPMIDADGVRARRNSVHIGDVYPAMVVRVFASAGTSANLQVYLDGDVSYWATSRQEGEGAGTWMWPPRVES